MASVKIDELLLDARNPRHALAKSQKDTIKKVLEEQKDKIAILAESIIAQRGLSPLDRILVLDKKPSDKGYIVLEGNRRVAALKVLDNPSLMDDAKISKGVRDKLDSLSGKFRKSLIEPIDVSITKSRKEARYWINLRHTGQNRGAGVVEWATTQQERFQGPSAQLEVLDFVRTYGKLSDYENGKLEGRFITTLRRLLDTPSVRQMIGIEKSGKSIFSHYPAIEIMKPLRRIVLDLALKRVNVTDIKSVDQMGAYIKSFSAGDLPNHTKISPQALATFTAADFASESPGPSSPGPGLGPKPTPPTRTGIIPPGKSYHVTEMRIRAIQTELASLRYSRHINAIAVLFRVFFETSVDYQLEKIGSSPKKANGRFKTLSEKAIEAIDDLVSTGADTKVFNPIRSALNSSSSPLWIDLLHSYIHNPSGSPTAPNLSAAWDHAGPLLKNIWK